VSQDSKKQGTVRLDKDAILLAKVQQGDALLKGMKHDEA
jgi:hypothetical protein